MPTPIVVQPRRNQFGQLLGTLLLQKIAHNQEMEREKLKIEAEKAQKGAVKTEEYEKEGRSPGPYKEGVTNPYTGDRWSTIPKPTDLAGYTPVMVNGKWQLKPIPESKTAYKEGQIVERKEGDKIIEYQYQGGNLVKTGKTAPRYKPTTNIYNQLSIAEKKRQTDLAEIRSPNYRGKIANDVKSLFSSDVWNYDLSETEKNNAIRKEMGRRIRTAYPSRRVEYADVDGKEGWYFFTEDGKPDGLIRPWE